MTDSWKADSRFISRSHGDSSEHFVPAHLRANDGEAFSPTMIVNEGSNENSAQSPVTYTQEELESKLAEMRQEVTDEVRQNLSSELESEKTNYRSELRQEFEAFLSAAKSKTVREEPFLEPIRALSLAFAGEISRAAFSSPQMNIEKAIDDCLIGLDLSSLDGLEIYVSRGWAEKLEKEPLAGILADYPVFIEESFGDGDVRLKLNSSQVENLVSDRIARLQEQLAKLDFGPLAEELKPSAMPTPREEEGESVETIGNLESADSEDSSEVLSSDTDGKLENDV